MSKIHLESLDKNRHDAFNRLYPFRNIGYLAGGTALALQINHRKSEDFDIFVNKTIDNNLKLKIRKVYGMVEYYVNSTDQISFKTAESIDHTFLWYYFKPLLPFVKTDIIPLASIEDIVADKAMTIGRRAVWRDYVDLFYLLETKYFTLDKIISLAKQKFMGEFVETQFLEQLSFFDDVKEVPINFIEKSYPTGEIKEYLVDEVKKYLHKIL